MADLPSISYEQHFHNYVMYIQDTNISEELKFAFRHNFLDAASINRLLNDYQERLMEL